MLRFPERMPFAVALCGIALLTACSSPGPTASTGVTITGVTVSSPASSFDVNTTIQLQATVQPAGAAQTVTWSVDDPALASVDNAGRVLAIAPGAITVTAVSTVDNTKSGSVQLTITGCPAPRTVTANPTGGAIWQDWIVDPSCFDYVVSVSIDLTDGTLGIDPGVVVGFEAGRRVRIAGNGIINALGTQARPIVFTGTTPQRGHWEGLLLQNSRDPANMMSWVTIEYAGGGTFSGGIQAANLMLHENTLVSGLSSITLRESAGYGLYVHSDVDLLSAVDLTLTRNVRGPAYTWASVAGDIVSGFLSTQSAGLFTGNDRDFLDVVPNVIDRPGVGWPDIGVPYRILQVANRQALQITGDLTVSGGAEIELEQDMALVVSGGTLRIGEQVPASQAIVTGTTKTPGHWRGIGVLGGRIELMNAIVEYGGGAIIGFGGQKPANVQLTTGAANTLTTLNMQSTVLSGSAAYGLYARAQQVVIEAFAAGNALLQNNAPAYIASTLVDRIEGGLFTGNAVDAIVVNTGGAPITSDATWRNHNVPYILEDGGPAATPIFQVENATLTFEPGVQVMVPANMGLQVRNGGLTAIGESMKPVIFGSATGPKWWGINLFDSTGTFDYFEIHNGGSLKWGTAGEAGNITVTTANGANPPESTVSLTPNVVFSGTPWSLVFASGDTYATGCPSSGVYVPPADQITDHCR